MTVNSVVRPHYVDFEVLVSSSDVQLLHYRLHYHNIISATALQGDCPARLKYSMGFAA